MAFQPMLVIGCGGSGGATLQYMMDNLRAQLSRHLEKSDLPPLKALPDAWQFVHVDVATTPDMAEEARPPTVQSQGGAFIGLANPGLTWKLVADDVWGRGREQRPDLVSGWLRKPTERDPVLTQGAGQERAVGRGVTLNSVTQLKDTLERAHGRMTAAGANSLRSLASAFGNVQISADPVVIIVSSMAGGSGASMVLDVPQVLSTIDPNLGRTTAMFLYTSEVFGDLERADRRGVEANGLAMMGEVFATSLGANDSDGELLRLLGVTGARTDQPFRRIFPIGRRSGTRGALFGDGSLESIYRAVGRALAGMVGSPFALDRFVRYDLVNPNPQPTDDVWLGEGTSDPNSVLWGTFGYSSLSLGRDRYGEYVAQLLARWSVDRLVSGHKRDDEATGEADLQLAAEDGHRRVLQGLGLSGESVTALSLLARSSSSETEMRQELQAEMKERLRLRVFSDGELSRALVGPAFVRTLQRILASTRDQMDSDVQECAYGRVYTWHQRFVTDLLDEITVVASMHGLAVARRVIDLLRADVAAWVGQLRTEAALPGRQEWTPSMPDQVLAQLNGLKAVVTGHPIQNTVLEGLGTQAAKSVAGSTARLLMKVLEDFGPSLASPLSLALADQEHALEQARLADPQPSGQSDLRAATYAEWPRKHAVVPPRFQGAHNEVVLYNYEEFPAEFDRHVQAMMASRKIGPEQAAESLMVTEILRNRWLQHNDDSAMSTVIVPTAPWTPADLVRDPAEPTRLAMRSSAQFKIKFGLDDVIERAREWVWRKDGEFGAFLRVGLSEYLDPTKREFNERLRQLSDRFDEALTQALPLVSVETAALKKVHVDNLTVNYKFSAVPFATNQTVRAMLNSELKQRASASGPSLESLDQAMIQGDSIDRIDVFASYAPMSPLAFGSLLQPLAIAWREAVSSRNTNDFWRNRRARPIPGALAMSPAERRSSIAGYVVSKITGRIRGSYTTLPGQPANPLEIFDEDGGRWLKFPEPLLTPFSEGYQKDEVVAILESQLLAIAECGFDQTLSPLLPYVTLRHTYAKVTQTVEETQEADGGGRTHDRATGRSYLTNWIVQGWRPPGAPPATWKSDVNGQDLDLTTASGRRDAAVAFVTLFRDEYAAYYHPEDPRLNPGLKAFDRRPMIASVVTDFVWALDAVLEVLQEISLDGRGPVATGPVLEM